MDLHDRVVRRDALRLQLDGAGLQLLDASSRARRAPGPVRGNTLSGLSDRIVLLELQHFVRGRVFELGAVARAVLEHHLDGPRLAIDDHAAALGEEDHRRATGSTCRPPARRASPGRSSGLRARRGRRSGKSSKKTRGRTSPSARFIAISVLISRKRLVAVGHRLQHHPRREAPADDREHQDRVEQPVRADAARHHHDDFAIGRQAAERRPAGR